MTSSNTSVKLDRIIPLGSATLDAFKIETVDSPTKDSLVSGQVLVRTLYLSIDPYSRMRLSESQGGAVPSFVPGKPIDSFGVGIVEASTSTKFSEGDLVTGSSFLWETRFILSENNITKVPSNADITPANYLGVLGMPSFTAYVGFASICNHKAGETILVSAASGAVGQMVVQLAKARGLRVIGAAGSNDKVDFVKSLGADVVFNYKTCGSLQKAIKEAAPEGVDIYFDNVGGEFLDAALDNMRMNGRIVACGNISQYNVAPETAYHTKNTDIVNSKKLTLYDFVILDYYDRPVYNEFIDEVSAGFKRGDIQYKLDEVVGLENAPQALLDLFEGKNFGKRVVKVSDLNGTL
ncbi:hypothetical protein GGI15_002133 [Coemansia interrupta]|uniref:Enoyl reductase (ER) domain-containing protein n=1 Tax=Coemansia interrupta TaxID=1126814 RepID=A0A9W8LJY4_9FUNG|nr:hypothetical protein GGI15_002133 [Coemansia interrupta]